MLRRSLPASLLPPELRTCVTRHAFHNHAYRRPYFLFPLLLQAEELRKCVSEYAELAVWVAAADQDGNPVVHIEATDLMAAGF